MEISLMSHINNLYRSIEDAKKFEISVTTLSKIFTTRINFLHQELTFLLEMIQMKNITCLVIISSMLFHQIHQSWPTWATMLPRTTKRHQTHHPRFRGVQPITVDTSLSFAL